MDRLSPQQIVFDIPELKYKILSYVVKHKYEIELKTHIRKMLDELITGQWFLYCSCELCMNKARDYFMGI